MHFWRGFYKRAESEGQGPIAEWIAEAQHDNDALKNKEPKKNDFDPREASGWISPETWHHNWPSSGHV